MSQDDWILRGFLLRLSGFSKPSVLAMMYLLDHFIFTVGLDWLYHPIH